MFVLTLTIEHPGLPGPVRHQSRVRAKSQHDLFKMINVPANAKLGRLNKHGYILWVDKHGAKHKLTLVREET